MSGHNKWSTIKHRKGAQDAKRGKIFTKIIKEITISARSGGGDPNGNPRLRRALDAAKAANMPSDNIERAIKKGTGELEGVNYEELVYEGVGPSGALLVMNVVTDNRNRTAAEIRKLFDKHNGQLGQSGSAAWAFDEKGVINLPADAATEEQLFEVAVSAGAEDVEKISDVWVVTTPREELDAVKTALEGAEIGVENANLEMIPKTPKVVEGRDAEVLMDLVGVLEDHDDIQQVFTDFELSDEALAALEAS
jgi:YebC/PmpR family DNA-binding regulatory protein